MTSTARLLTLGVAAVVLVLGAFAGFRLLTSSADTADPAPTCTNKTVAKGGKLPSNMVKVSVYNASNRSGLANRVTINLQTNGFLGGTIGNSDSAAKPKRVAILTSDRADPRVRLVARQFKDKVDYAKPDIEGATGVVVVVGDDYRGLKKKAPTTIRSDREISACVPAVALP
jgi:hypothetical protein